MPIARKLSRAWAAMALLSLALAAPAARGSAPPEPKFVPGQLLVRFEPGTSRAESKAVARELRARITDRFEIVPGAALLDLPDGLGVRRADRQLTALDEVRLAEPDFIRRIAAIPDDTLFGQLWGLNNTGQSVNGTLGTPDADIDAPEAWNTSTGTSTVTVGVIDTGLATAHPDIDGNLWVNTGEIPGNSDDDDLNGFEDDVNGWDFVDGDNTTDDPNTHGTHVAGIAGAEGNNAL